MMEQCKIAIATNALGKAASGHSIQRRLLVAKQAGFDGVEVAIECLEALAADMSPSEHQHRAANLRKAATYTRKIADTYSLEIIALNPFAAFDALKDDSAVEQRLQEAKLWLELCNLMRCEILQIPSCTYPVAEADTTPDISRTVANLKRLCLLAQSHRVKVAYEAVAWGIHINRWEQAHEVIRQVNMPNMTHCLDTYHIASRTVGNPLNLQNPINVQRMPDLAESLADLTRSIKPSEIGYFQLSDASVADPEQHGYPRRDLNQPPFMVQSRNCRMFVCEPARYGGVLPALQVARAVFATGYRGWVSLEAFSLDMWDRRSTVPEEYAARGKYSWNQVKKLCNLSSAKSNL